jgi:hypothetical protein
MIRKLLAVLAAVPLLLGGLTGATRPAAPRDCAGLTADTRVTSAAETDGYCQVDGVLPPATHFTLKLPVEGWTGEYVQSGCSGLCGVVLDPTYPALGYHCEAERSGHLAVASDDTGHAGDQEGTGPATWGADPQARREFALTSEHRLRLAADALITAYYGHGPSYRYFDGCSTGGRQALNLAQRFPADFDGILAGAPASNFGPLNLLQAWLAVSNTDRSGHQILGPEKIPALHAAVVKACGEMIADPRKCGFQPSSLRCPPGTDRPTCLTPAQVVAVVAFYRGPGGLYNGGLPYGSELGWVDWFLVPSGSPLDSFAGKLALNFFRYLDSPTPRPSFQLTDVRFDRATFERLTHLYDANDPDLSAFRTHGGKLILYHGWADPLIPPFSTVDYYRAVQKRGGSDAFTRLYMIPGGYHCLVGPNISDPTELSWPEFVQPLFSWVERGVAPGVIDAQTVLLSNASEVISDVKVAPFDALAPVHAAPHSLNANYHYIGHY